MTSTYHITTLGCAKNQVDSDKLEARLRSAGYVPTEQIEEADLLMVNTCAFIEDARRESVETILSVQDSGRDGASTVVLGCMAQRFGAEVSAALPEVNVVLGLDRYGELIPRLDGLAGPEPVQIRRRPVMDILHQVERPAPATPYAYVKVAEGCDKPCTFCAIPSIRGRQRSRRPAEIRSEVEGLAANGVSELVLVAQDLAAYGRDMTGGDRKPDIAALLGSLAEVEGVRSLRLLYLYPREIRPALMEEMTSNPKVAPYFDLSLQHATRRLLRAMRRPGGAESHLRLIDEIRSRSPQAALRSSFIVGFPGETDQEVDELADFLTEARLDWAGFFPYSPEVGTPAARLEGRVPPGELGDRLRHLQGVQEDITLGANLAQVGRRVEVLVDQIEEGTPVGRSYRQAPEIDGMILLDAGDPGEWLEAELTAAFGADMEARRVGVSTEARRVGVSTEARRVGVSTEARRVGS